MNDQAGSNRSGSAEPAVEAPRLPPPSEATRAAAGVAFDRIAPQYDQASTDVLISRWIRQRVWNRLADLFPRGSHVLELGCGTGEDAVWLAQQGIRVTATDASPQMIALTAEKAARAGVSAMIHTRVLDLNSDLSTVDLSAGDLSAGLHANSAQAGPLFDGVYSNYGVLNCIRDWQALGQGLSAHLRVGARAGFAVMGRYCPWEMAWHTLHGDWRTAFRRVSGQAQATIGTVTFPVYYPTPRRFAQDLRAQFAVTHLEGLGVWLPPSDAYGAIGKRQRLARLLRRLERLTAAWWPFNSWGDHFWIELTRR